MFRGFRRPALLALSELLAICAVSLVASFSAHAKDTFELESRYNGDGWFQYTWRTLEDPFFRYLDTYQLVPYPFTNYVQSVTPTNWFNAGGYPWDGIRFDQSYLLPRIYEVSFSAKSTFTHFRRVHQGFIGVVSFWFVDAYSFGASSAVGGVPIDCLLPCTADEADGSPSVLITRREMIPDIKIDQLFVTNGQIYGLSFSWSEPSTIELQGSRDMTNWTRVARFFGDPPQSSWTTNVPLNSYGEFFRLTLLANAHYTNALALTSFTANTETKTNVPCTASIAGNQLTISFNSVPKAVYQIDSRQWPEKITSSLQLKATDTFTKQPFDLRNLPGPLLLNVRQVPPD